MLPAERRHIGARPTHCGARVTTHDKALRSDDGRDQLGRDRTHHPLKNGVHANLPRSGLVQPTLDAVKHRPHTQRRPDDKARFRSSEKQLATAESQPRHDERESSSRNVIPAFAPTGALTSQELRGGLTEACQAWLARSPSFDTRQNYARDLRQFFIFLGVPPDRVETLIEVRPPQVAALRDQLREQGLTNSSIRRKMTVLRSLFSYLQTYGYTGANPAHSRFVEAPAVPRDGKTVGLTPEECRRLIDAPNASTPVGVRDRAILGLLAYSACRVGEITRLRVGDYKTTGGHRVLEVFGKGGKERRVPLHPEAMERIEAWLDQARIREDVEGSLFRAGLTARAQGRDGFRAASLTRRAVQFLVKRYARSLGLDPAVTVHSFRVTALTTARERDVDIIDLQDFAGHADPRTTLSYIRQRDRLSKSPAVIGRIKMRHLWAELGSRCDDRWNLYDWQAVVISLPIVSVHRRCGFGRWTWWAGHRP